MANNTNNTINTVRLNVFEELIEEFPDTGFAQGVIYTAVVKPKREAKHANHKKTSETRGKGWKESSNSATQYGRHFDYPTERRKKKRLMRGKKLTPDLDLVYTNDCARPFYMPYEAMFEQMAAARVSGKRGN